ncbi:MAG: ubiquinone/menaquinone biosynthesis methyltransferase [Dehalococcoidia bacterium]|jgi:demethylmenaquinone methyltransferase/2-methoxy-6-polyprenyl-1,4-benzoquinol methylase|nr:ubiquinone/menaquinone biosynthesis methyltransferase [Dehalococcoidia bacterium]
MVQLKGDEKARYVATLFDRISERYDLLNTVMSGGMHHRWRRRAACLAVQEDQGEALDLATGTGDFALDLVRGPGVARVVGLDFAPKMLRFAQSKTKRRGLSHRVEWMLGDAQSLPFTNDHFLYITIGFGLRNFANKEAALAEIFRVIRPGGRVVVLDIVPLAGGGILQRLLRAYFRGVVPRLGTFVAGNNEAYKYLPDSVDSYLTPQELSIMMENAGLQRVWYKMLGLGTLALHVGEKPVGTG